MTDPNDGASPRQSALTGCVGFTKREALAKGLLEAAFSNPNINANTDGGEHARVAVMMADALIRELNKTKP